MCDKRDRLIRIPRDKFPRERGSLCQLCMDLGHEFGVHDDGYGVCLICGCLDLGENGDQFYVLYDY